MERVWNQGIELLGMCDRMNGIKRFENEGRVIIYNPLTHDRVFLNIGEEADLETIERLHKGKPMFDMPELKKVRVEVTLDCNGGCDYCLVFNNEIQQLFQPMSIEVANNIIDFFKENVRDGSFMIIGGEPLTNLEVTEHLIHNVNGRVSLYTNGTLIDKKLARKLRDEDVITFVSLDEPREFNRHRRYRGGEELFEHSLRGYKILKDAGCKTGITCLVTDDNVGDIADIVKYFTEELECESMGLSIPHFTRLGRFTIDMEKYVAGMRDVFKYSKREGVYIDQIAKRLLPLVERRFRLYACKIVGEQVTFYPNGKQTTCTKLDTIKDYNFSKEELIQKLPLYDEDCSDCHSIGICGGGCFWDAHHDSKGKDSRDCYFNNAMLEVFLWDIERIYREMGKDDVETLRLVYSDILTH